MMTTEKIANFIISHFENKEQKISNRKLSALVLLFYGIQLIEKETMPIEDVVVVDVFNHVISTEVMNAVYKVGNMPHVKEQVKSKDTFSFFDFKNKQIMQQFMSKYDAYTEGQLYQLYFDKIIEQSATTSSESSLSFAFSIYKAYFENFYLNKAVEVSQSLSDFQQIDSLNNNELNQFKLFLSRIYQQNSKLTLGPINELLKNNTLNINSGLLARAIRELSQLLNVYSTLSHELSEEEMIDMNKQLLNITEDLKACVVSKEDFMKHIRTLDRYYEIKHNSN